MPIRDFCRGRDKVETVPPGETLRGASRLMDRTGVGCVVVVEGEEVQGILTDRDIALAVFEEGVDPDATPVQAMLSSSPVVVEGDRPLRAVAATLERHHLRRLPVVDRDGQLLGIISRDDVAQLLAKEFAGVARALHIQEPHGSALLKVEDLSAAFI